MDKIWRAEFVGQNVVVACWTEFNEKNLMKFLEIWRLFFLNWIFFDWFYFLKILDWSFRSAKKRPNERRNEWLKERMNERMDKWMNERMDKRMDKRMDEWTKYNWWFISVFALKATVKKSSLVRNLQPILEIIFKMCLERI